MGTKLLWLGLTFILAVAATLRILGLNASNVVELVGAVFMVIGCVLLLNDK